MAILGIFVAIILAFVSGLVFSSSVLQNIDKTNIYKLSLVSLIIGFFIVNILFFLFNFILRIIKDDTQINPDMFKHPVFCNFNIIMAILILIFFIVSVLYEKIQNKDKNSTVNIIITNLNVKIKE